MNASTNLKAWRALLVLGILAIMVQAARAATFANVTFNMEDFTTLRASNKWVEIFPYSTPFSTNSAIIHNDRKRYNTGTNGTFTITNMVPGCYKVQSSGAWTMTPFNICLTNNSGNLNAHDLLTTVVTVVDALRRFVQVVNGVLASPTNFFSANLFAGLNVTFTTNALGQITINAATNGVSIGNAVIHNGSGVLTSPTNFFHANIFKGTNIVFTTNALGQITISSTATGGGSGTVWTNSIDIWLSTRTDADGDGTITNPRRADTVSAFDNIMIAYAAQSNLTFRLHPGRYYTRGFCPDAPAGGKWQMGRNWRVIGSGIDQSILTLTNTIGGDSSNRRFYHVIGSDHSVDSSYSEVADITIDCNLDNLTIPATTNQFKTIAACKLNGSHTAIRRVKAIHFGVDGAENPAVNDDVFVLSAAATFPQHAPRGSHTIIEDCILMYPSKLTTQNIVEFIHTSGAMNIANALMAFTTNIVIRNNHIDGRFEDGTVKTRLFNSDLWHGLTLGSCEIGIVEGNHVEGGVDVGGNYQDSFRSRSIIVRDNTFLDVDGGGYWNFGGLDGEPEVGLGVSGIITTGTTAVMTISQALHDLIPGIDIVQVFGATDSAYNTNFLVRAATANTITFELPTPPGDPTPAGTIKWRVHRGVREIFYQRNTHLLRHGSDLSYAVGLIGPWDQRSDLPVFHTVDISDNFFGFSDGKATNNTLGSVGILVRNAGNARITGNVMNLYTNTPSISARQNIIVRNSGSVTAFNNRTIDGVSIPAHDTGNSRYNDMLSALEYRIRETNGGLEYVSFTAGVMSSNTPYVWPTTIGAGVLTSDGAFPANLSWGTGSSGIALLNGSGTNVTFRASAASGQTNLILRALAGQTGDMTTWINPGGFHVASVGANGHLRVAAGTATTNSIGRFDDPGDGISFGTDITRFLFGGVEKASVGNTTGFFHKSDSAALTLGAAGDAILKRVALGSFDISSNAVAGNGLLQLARLQFVESQGETTQTLQFLAPNMTASQVYLLPSTPPTAGSPYLVGRVLSGITNKLEFTNAPAGGTSVLSGDYLANLNGISTNWLSYGQNFLATNASLVISNTSSIRFTNSQVAINGSGAWINSAVGSTPLIADAMAGSTSNLFTLRLAGADRFMVNPAGKVLVMDGDAATPAIARLAAPNDGLFLNDGLFTFTKDGATFAALVASGATSGIVHTAANPAIQFGAAQDTILARGVAGEWVASTSTTAATGAGLGSFTGTNFNVLGAIKVRESAVGTPDAFLTLRMPPGVSIANFETRLWTNNGTAGQALKTDGQNLYFADDLTGGGGAGIAVLNGTGTELTVNNNAVGDVPLKVQSVASQTAALQTWSSSVPTVLAQVNALGTLSLPLGSAALPSITRLGAANEGIALLDDITRFTFNGVAAVDIVPSGINTINLTSTGTNSFQGPVTYTVRSATLGGAGSSAPGRIDGALGNLFKITLTTSTNLVLTNMLPGVTTVIITNPANFTVSWNLLTNQWLGLPLTNSPAQAWTNVTYWSFYREGVNTNGSAVSRGVPVTPYYSVASASTVTLDFNSNPEQFMNMLGNVTTWTSTGMVDGVRNISLLISANGTNRTFGTFPANWRWMTAIPTGIGAVNVNQRGILNLKSYTPSDTAIMASWHPQL